MRGFNFANRRTLVILGDKFPWQKSEKSKFNPIKVEISKLQSLIIIIIIIFFKLKVNFISRILFFEQNLRKKTRDFLKIFIFNGNNFREWLGKMNEIWFQYMPYMTYEMKMENEDE